MNPTRLDARRTGTPARAGWPALLRLADLEFRPRAAHRWAILAGAVLLMGLIGPFGTYLGMSLPMRLVHFTGTVTGISALIVLIRALFRRWLFPTAMPIWGELVIALVAAPPGGLVVLALLSLTAPHALPHVSWLELTAQTLVVNIVLVLAIHGLATRAPAPVAPAGDGPAETGNGTARPIETRDARHAAEDAGEALRQKLPLPLRRAAILSLSAEDHYVRVVTDRGRVLVLMPLSEAADALGPEAGMRIHRSHWVSRQVLETPGTSLSRATVRLADGTVLPVSRTGRRALVEAGLA